LQATGGSPSIAGLFDLSETNGAGQEDVSYVEILDDGTMTFYDYLQDATNEGDNCYDITEGLSVLSLVSNNEFINTYYSDISASCETISEPVTIVRTETELSTTSIDTRDLDADGDTTETIVELSPIVSGISTESFNRCE